MDIHLAKQRWVVAVQYQVCAVDLPTIGYGNSRNEKKIEESNIFMIPSLSAWTKAKKHILMCYLQKIANIHMFVCFSCLLHTVTFIRGIHTPQLNFLLSDWLFSKYAECIENVHCTPRTAPRLREVLLVRDLARKCHVD